MNATTKTTDIPPGFLTDEFPPHTYDQWKAAAEALLKGAPFEKKLLTPLHEGITLQPIYRREDAAKLPHYRDLPGLGSRVRGRRASGYLVTPWLISQELVCATPSEFNRVALHELENGQTELNIPLDEAARSGRDPDHSSVGEVGRGGLSLSTVGDLDQTLRGIHIDMLSLYFRTGTAALPMATLLFAYAKKHAIPFEKISGCLEADPLGNLAIKGELSISLQTAWRNIAVLTKFADAHAPRLQTLVVQGQPYADGGATTVEELGFVIATAVEYIRQMDALGVSPATTANHMRLCLSIGGNFFLEIAKLRAARLLFDRVMEAFGEKSSTCGIHIHARTASWNKTIYDPYVNMLRTTTEAFAAVIGGCDSLHVSPFDESIRLPDEFSRRIARNTQIILAEECDLTHVVDPAGGSWYLEWLTDQVAAHAWTVFQKIEAAGGMTKALEAELPQQMVAASAAKKAKAIAQRRDIIVGTNMYPNPTERPLENREPDYPAIFRDRSIQTAELRKAANFSARDKALADFTAAVQSGSADTVPLGIAAFEAGATLGEVTRALWSGEGSFARAIPITRARAAEPFEHLRKTAEHILEQTGSLPRILQANIGPSRSYRARADWTSAFFQVGGFEVLNDTDFKGVDDAVSAAIASGAKIIVITSTDDIYAEIAAPLAKALKAALPQAKLLLAGTPGDNEPAWREAGIDDFVHVRVNNYEMLKSLLETR